MGHNSALKGLMGILNGRGKKLLLLLDCVDWINVAEDRNKWRAAVNIPVA
jgi:hypothetical protein